jgi:hypothetical protein
LGRLGIGRRGLVAWRGLIAWKRLIALSRFRRALLLRREGCREIELWSRLDITLGFEDDLVEDGDGLVGHHHVLRRRASSICQIENVIDIIVVCCRLSPAAQCTREMIDHLRVGRAILGIIGTDLLRIL